MAVIVSAFDGAIEGPAAGEHFVENRAEREDVRPVVRRLTAHLLGRHVAGGPHHRTRRGLRVAPVAAGSASGCGQLREAEVENLDLRRRAVTNMFSGFRSR